MTMDDPKKPRNSKPQKTKPASEAKESPTETVCFEFPIEWGDASHDARHDAGGTCKRLIAIGKMIGSIIQVFGDGVGVPSATHSGITIPVQVPTKAQQLVPHPTLCENFERTAQELRDNVTKGLLRPHAVALSDQTLVPILKAIADNQVTGEAPPVLVDTSGRHEVPVLDSQDFDEPLEQEASTQTGTFPICGVRIGSTRDVLILSSGGLAIRADGAYALKILRWNLQVIYDGAWAEGRIDRGDDRVWELQAGAKLVTSDPIVGPQTDDDKQPD